MIAAVLIDTRDPDHIYAHPMGWDLLLARLTRDNMLLHETSYLDFYESEIGRR